MKTSTQNISFPSMSERLVLAGCEFHVPLDLIKSERVIRHIVLMITGSALIALCAQIYIPLYPIPITMQTFAVFLIGLTYGWRLGGTTIVLYLVLGAFGLPVFASGGLGMAVFKGPSAGFLFGFLPAAIACGWFAERGFDRSYVKLLVSLLIGNILLYVLGLFWLGYFFIGWEKTLLEKGLFPFVLGDLIKIFLVVILLPSVWKYVNLIKP